ncbi:MAG: PGF-CTERM sorting domain-containing protein [Candidatus Methanoperedens sp.]|nr:PGF-CTERM sorting domain-containing protein [Candidatus Methanoperedens sp.]
MKPGYILIIILASVLILSFAIVQINKDVLRKEAPPWIPPSSVSIREVDVKPVEVTSARIEMNVTAYINHNGGKTRNASMLIRAINSDTRLLETQVSAPIPETESEFEKTLPVSTNLNVERNGGYELNILLFDNGSIRDSGTVNIRGLNALTPESKRSGVTLNNIDFTVGGVSAGKVSIKSDIYLENKGPDVSENLKMTVKAREATSNLIADKTDAETGAIVNETTVVRSVQLVVPDEYNYMVVVELWRGDTMINTWEKPVLLAPTKTVPKESVETNTNIEVSKFVREAGATAPSVMRQDSGGYQQGAVPTQPPQEPGFEIFAAISALFVVFIMRRRS